LQNITAEPILMQFSDESIEKFRMLYSQRFGKDLDRKTAFEYAQKLFRAIELTYVQMSVADFKNLQKRRKETKPDSHH